MKFSFNQQTLSNVLKQRDLALWSCLGLVISQTLLAFKVLHQEEHWVIFPLGQEDNKIELTASRYSDEYFRDWGCWILDTLLCVNPNTIDRRITQILSITTEKYGDLKDRLLKEAATIKKDQISTVFYPKKFEINQVKKEIDITGEHVAYLGKDTNPVTTTKTYRLTWIIRKNGVVLLQDFKDIANDK